MLTEANLGISSLLFLVPSTKTLSRRLLSCLLLEYISWEVFIESVSSTIRAALSGFPGGCISY